MSQGHLVGVLVRLFALYLLVSTLRSAPGLIVSNQTAGSDPWAHAWIAAALILPLSAAIFLWFFNLSVAKRLFYSGASERNLELEGVSQLEHALFSLLGLWLICASLVDAMYWIVYFHEVPQYGWDLTTPEIKAGVACCIFQLLLGTFLFFRSKGLLNIVRRIRA